MGPPASARATHDPVKWQLLNQSTLPGFEPSEDSYAPKAACERTAAPLRAQPLDMLAAAPDYETFVGPDQAALEQMLTQMEPVRPDRRTRDRPGSGKRMVPKIANTDMAAGWDGPEGEHWVEYAEQYSVASQRHWDRLLAVVPIASDAAVVDIGCGTGGSTRDAARIASSGSALGLDLSSAMLKRAREVAKAEGLGNVQFEQADVQVHPFDAGRFDLAISAFGAMFFADPTAAFANVNQAMRPGGELALLSWRELARNEWLTALRDALAVGRQLPEPPSGLPGPFGLAGADQVSGILIAAGFADIRFEEVDEPIEFGADADAAFAFMKTFGITRGLTEELDGDGKARALDALQRTIDQHDTGEGVLFGSSAWLIRALCAR